MSDTPRTDHLDQVLVRPGREKGILDLCRELERELARLERNFNALDQKFSAVLTDENYVGGVRYWVAKHDALLVENAKLVDEAVEHCGHLDMQMKQIAKLREAIERCACNEELRDIAAKKP